MTCGTILFVDIVGYSQRSQGDQEELVSAMTRVTRAEVDDLTSAWAPGVVMLPTGDGLAIVFLEGTGNVADRLLRAMHLAVLLLEAVKAAGGQLRMGIHAGEVSRIDDVNNQRNVFGPTINMAQRVMDAANADQCLIADAAWEPCVSDAISVRGPISLHGTDRTEAVIGEDVHSVMIKHRRRMAVRVVDLRKDGRLLTSSGTPRSKDQAVLEFTSLPKDGERFQAMVSEARQIALVQLTGAVMLPFLQAGEFRDDLKALWVFMPTAEALTAMQGRTDTVGNGVQADMIESWRSFLDDIKRRVASCDVYLGVLDTVPGFGASVLNWDGPNGRLHVSPYLWGTPCERRPVSTSAGPKKSARPSSSPTSGCWRNCGRPGRDHGDTGETPPSTSRGGHSTVVSTIVDMGTKRRSGRVGEHRRGMKITGFCSYSRIDWEAEETVLEHAFAYLQAQTRRAYGSREYELWRDEEQLKWRDEWPEELEAAVKGCDHFVVFLSLSWLRSPHCRREAESLFERGDDAKNRLFVAEIDDLTEALDSLEPEERKLLDRLQGPQNKRWHGFFHLSEAEREGLLRTAGRDIAAALRARGKSRSTGTQTQVQPETSRVTSVSSVPLVSGNFYIPRPDQGRLVDGNVSVLLQVVFAGWCRVETSKGTYVFGASSAQLMITAQDSKLFDHPAFSSERCCSAISYIHAQGAVRQYRITSADNGPLQGNVLAENQNDGHAAFVTLGDAGENAAVEGRVIVDVDCIVIDEKASLSKRKRPICKDAEAADKMRRKLAALVLSEAGDTFVLEGAKVD